MKKKKKCWLRKKYHSIILIESLLDFKMIVPSSLAPFVVPMFEHVPGRRIEDPETPFAAAARTSIPQLFVVIRRIIFVTWYLMIIFSRYKNFTLTLSIYVVIENLDKAVVEAEVVPYAILPALTVDPIEWKPIHDVLVYSRQSEPTFGGWVYSHRYQGYVRVRWLFSVLLVMTLIVTQSLV